MFQAYAESLWTEHVPALAQFPFAGICQLCDRMPVGELTRGEQGQPRSPITLRYVVIGTQ